MVEQINKKKIEKMLSMPLSSFSQLYDYIKDSLNEEEKRYLLNVVNANLIAEANRRQEVKKGR